MANPGTSLNLAFNQNPTERWRYRTADLPHIMPACYRITFGGSVLTIERHDNAERLPRPVVQLARLPLFSCEDCDFKTIDKTDLHGHAAKLHNKFYCEKCNYTASGLRWLKRHTLMRHRSLRQTRKIGRSKQMNVEADIVVPGPDIPNFCWVECEGFYETEESEQRRVRKKREEPFRSQEDSDPFAASSENGTRRLRVRKELYSQGIGEEGRSTRRGLLVDRLEESNSPEVGGAKQKDISRLNRKLSKRGGDRGDGGRSHSCYKGVKVWYDKPKRNMSGVVTIKVRATNGTDLTVRRKSLEVPNGFRAIVPEETGNRIDWHSTPHFHDYCKREPSDEVKPHFFTNSRSRAGEFLQDSYYFAENTRSSSPETDFDVGPRHRPHCEFTRLESKGRIFPNVKVSTFEGGHFNLSAPSKGPQDPSVVPDETKINSEGLTKLEVTREDEKVVKVDFDTETQPDIEGYFVNCDDLELSSDQTDLVEYKTDIFEEKPGTLELYESCRKYVTNSKYSEDLSTKCDNNFSSKESSCEVFELKIKNEDHRRGRVFLASVCYYCGLKFGERKGLMDHVREVHRTPQTGERVKASPSRLPENSSEKEDDKRLLECHHCGFTVRRRKGLVAHMRKVHGMCAKGAVVVQHCLGTRHAAGPCRYLCPECGFRTCVKSTFSLHKREHYGPFFRCTECAYRSVRRRDVELHAEARHTSRDCKPGRKKRRPFPCRVCPYAATTARAIEYHRVFMHGDELPLYACFRCNFASASARGLLNHNAAKHGESTHSLVEPENELDTAPRIERTVQTGGANGVQLEVPTVDSHPCPQCSYRATRLSRLNEHIQNIHSGVKPFHCIECGYRTSRRSDLLRHVAARHPDTVSRYPALASPAYRILRCQHCEFTTRRKCELTRHLSARHYNRRGHTCDRCDYAAVQATDLAKHKAARHGVNATFHRCRYCTYRSLRPSRVRKHLEDMHGIPRKKMTPQQ